MAKKDIKRFLFNCEWNDTLSKLPDASYLKIIKALVKYVRDGVLPELDFVESIAFDFIRKELDWNEDKYKESRKRRSKAGRLGGIQSGIARRAKQSEANEANEAMLQNRSNAKQCEANEANNVNVNVNDNGLSNDNIEKEIALTCKEKAQAEKPKKKTSEWKKPTVEEIRAFALEKGYTNVDPEDFWNFYESKGWMVGSNHMTKWRASVALWNRSQHRQRNRAPDRNPGFGHYEGERDPDVYEKLKQQLKQQQQAQ